MKVGFIGGGNMANAIIGGLIANGAKASDLLAIDVNPEALDKLHTAYGISIRSFPDKSLSELHLWVLAIKPQQMSAVAASVKPFLGDQSVVSIAAGIRTDDLARWLGGYPRIIRAMPNTPALVRVGATGLYARPEVSATQRAQAEALMRAVGEVVWLDDEASIDAVTALSGSGPAYAFYLLEAMQEAGVSLGLTPEASRLLAQQTLLGAATLALGSSESPATLRERVTSKGGTTERALEVMESHQIKAHVVQAIRAACERGRELGDQFGAVQ